MEGMEGSCLPSVCSCFVCLKNSLNFEMPFNFLDFCFCFLLVVNIAICCPQSTVIEKENLYFLSSGLKNNGEVEERQ